MIKANLLIKNPTVNVIIEEYVQEFNNTEELYEYVKYQNQHPLLEMQIIDVIELGE